MAIAANEAKGNIEDSGLKVEEGKDVQEGASNEWLEAVSDSHYDSL